jgi:hypothetical protein
MVTVRVWAPQARSVEVDLSTGRVPMVVEAGEMLPDAVAVVTDAGEA